MAKLHPGQKLSREMPLRLGPPCSLSLLGTPEWQLLQAFRHHLSDLGQDCKPGIRWVKFSLHLREVLRKRSQSEPTRNRMKNTDNKFVDRGAILLDDDS